MALFEMTTPARLTGLLLSLAALPAAASSTASSASVEGSSASVGSLSGSIEASSTSSAQTVVAAGPYRVVEVAALEDGAQRVSLQALDGGRPLALRLPAAAAAAAQLRAGEQVDVRARPYGLQLARADVREPFFLLLDDAAWRALQSRPVTL